MKIKRCVTVKEKEWLFLGSSVIIKALNVAKVKQQLAANKLKESIQNNYSNLKEENKSLRKINKEIEVLLSHYKGAKCKPPLICYRGEEWFIREESIIYFTGKSFMPAKVYNKTKKNGHTQLSIQFIRKQSQYCLNVGCGVVLTVCDPRIVKMWEYEYFKKEHRFASIWARLNAQLLTDNKYFNANDFVRTLALLD